MSVKNDRPLQVSRRGIVRGVAWATPAILTATAVPAFAASCTPVTLNWSNYPNNFSFTSATVGGVLVSVTQTNVVNAQNFSTVEPNNKRIYGSTLGGMSKSLAFAVYPTYGGAGTTPAITFNQPVTNVQFTFLDIDGSGLFQDRVTVLTPGYTVVSMGSAITQSTNVFTGNGLVASTSAAGNLTLNWAGPVTSISFNYRQGVGGDDSAFIGLSNITFRPTSC